MCQARDAVERQTLSWLWQLAGLAFCVVWALAILAFPYRRGAWGGYVPVVFGAMVGSTLCLPSARSALNRWISHPRSGPFLLWTVVLGLALRLLTLLIQPTELVSDPAIYHAKALAILSGEGYGQTAFLPPGLPLILAGWYWITTPHPSAGYLFGILLGTAAIPLCFDAGRRVVSPVAARWAALLTAIMPTLVFSAADVHTTSLLVILVLGTIVLTLQSADSRRMSWWSVLGLGTVIGIGSLVKTVFLPVPILVLLSWLVLGLGRMAIYKFAAATTVAACIVAPWTMRNYTVLGAFVPVSTNGGYVLYHGMNPKTDGMWSPVLESLSPTDEIHRDKMARDAALEWMQNHPVECARLMARKQAFMWGTSSTNIAVRFNPSIPPGLHVLFEAGIKFLINAGWTVLMVLCFKSTLTTSVWKERKFTLGALFVFYVFTSHLFFEVQSRYHIPVIPILILIASSGMVSLLDLRCASLRRVARASCQCFGR